MLMRYRSSGRLPGVALVASVALFSALGVSAAVPAGHRVSPTPGNAGAPALAGENDVVLEADLPDCDAIEMGSETHADADPDAPTATCKVPETDIGVPNPVQKHPIPLESEPGS